MSALDEVRAARDLASGDQKRTIKAVHAELRRLGSPQWQELSAALSANTHELELLHRREVSLVGSGTEPTPELP